MLRTSDNVKAIKCGTINHVSMRLGDLLEYNRSKMGHSKYLYSHIPYLVPNNSLQIIKPYSKKHKRHKNKSLVIICIGECRLTANDGPQQIDLIDKLSVQNTCHKQARQS
jgi:hypothetical protein